MKDGAARCARLWSASKWVQKIYGCGCTWARNPSRLETELVLALWRGAHPSPGGAHVHGAPAEIPHLDLPPLVVVVPELGELELASRVGDARGRHGSGGGTGRGH